LSRCPDLVGVESPCHRVDLEVSLCLPLTDRVVALLEEAKAQGAEGSRWFFSGIKGGSVAARAVKAGTELGRATGGDGEPLLPFSFHRHDLRRTCATMVYQRYEFDAEKRAALEARDRWFEGSLTAKPAEALTFARR
jgi:hypothetical protein